MNISNGGLFFVGSGIANGSVTGTATDNTPLQTPSVFLVNGTTNVSDAAVNDQIVIPGFNPNTAVGLNGVFYAQSANYVSRNGFNKPAA